MCTKRSFSFTGPISIKIRLHMKTSNSSFLNKSSIVYCDNHSNYPNDILVFHSIDKIKLYSAKQQKISGSILSGHLLMV